LHFGSLLAAIASYLQARTNGGRWIVRIEDIDPPRAKAGADQAIIATLRRYGFSWDGPILYQSESGHAHTAYISKLLNRGLAYPCSCSRRELADTPTGPLGHIYPGTCRGGYKGARRAIRVRCDDEPIRFDDSLQGPGMQRLESESGDFLIRRGDGLTAYQLAVAVDDHLQGVTEVVRGIDLLDSTPRQIYLQRLCGFATPRYCHIPVAVRHDGRKLSKLSGASGIAINDPRPVLVAALIALGQKIQSELGYSSLETIWDWAFAHWNIAVLKGVRSVAIEDSSLARH